MGRKHDINNALCRVCRHKLADPAGTLTIVKSRGQAAIGSNPSMRAATMTFPLTVAEFDTLVNWGLLQPARNALRGAGTPTAFEVTDLGWQKFRELSQAQT